MLIDTHCHLDFPEFNADREFVLKRARAAGVEAIINVASSLNGSQEAVRLAATYADVFATVGVHPHDAKECGEEVFLEIKKLLGTKKVVAIGEVGLDYYRNLSDQETQRRIFRRFLEMAPAVHLPLIIHSREAEDDTLSLVKEFDVTKMAGVVVHCFSGGADFLKKCLDLGFFVSFTCNVTYKKAHDLRNLVSLVPLDRMFLETDAPFLPPEGKRGKRNEPAFMVALAEEVARVKQMDLQKVCAETTKNAITFFALPIDYRLLTID